MRDTIVRVGTAFLVIGATLLLGTMGSHPIVTR